VIEVVSAQRCIGCDKCVQVCPTNVFDSGSDGIPVIARQEDCQTCFMCEAYCPVDALFVAPTTHPQPPDAPLRDESRLAGSELLGSYRARIGWGRGRTPGARVAVGPEVSGFPAAAPPAGPSTPSAPSTPLKGARP
jgi:NAD-dependent dihydropyrimidine dehydrogenase PreA subunit